MIRLTALVPAAVCAGALGRAWPDDVDGQVRCIDEGTRALGLAYCCSPWSEDAEDAALLAELVPDLSDSQPPAGAAPSSETSPPAGAAPSSEISQSAGAAPSSEISQSAGAAPSSETSPPTQDQGPVDSAFERLEAVTSGLVGTPGALPTLGLVSGPLWWGTRLVAGNGRNRGLPVDPVEAVDAASDLATERIRALASCGVERVAVVEAGAPGPHIDASIAAELHEPLRRAADHLRVDLLLVATGPVAGVPAPAELGYARWVSPEGCADGLGFLPAAALQSQQALSRWARRAPQAAGAVEVVTAPLSPAVSPEQIRSAVALVGDAASGAES